MKTKQIDLVNLEAESRDSTLRWLQNSQKEKANLYNEFETPLTRRKIETNEEISTLLGLNGEIRNLICSNNFEKPFWGILRENLGNFRIPYFKEFNYPFKSVTDVEVMIEYLKIQ